MTDRDRRVLTGGERIRGQLLRRTPTWALLAAAAGIGLGRGLRWLAVHFTVAATLTLAALTWWAIDRGWWPWLMLATGMICLGMGAAMELQPRWWRRLATVTASRRRLTWYRKRWQPAMAGAGLARGDDLPKLMGHRFGGQPWEQDLDVLTVRTLDGQTLADWRHVSDRLAAAWGRTRVRAHGRRPDGNRAPAVLELFCSSRPLPTATIRRATVAGGLMPPTLSTPTQGPVDVPPTLSTAVEEPVDDASMESGMPSGPQPGAFPRTPRADR